MDKNNGDSEYKPNKPIDDQFITTWHPQYDLKIRDEGEYQTIVRKVEIEKSNRELTADTFYSILRWKWAGLTGKISRGNYVMYLDTIAGFWRKPANDTMDKMKVLDDLPMVGPPVASTILHFICPKSVPIYDVRTVGVLYYCGYISNRTNAFKHYELFKEAILSVQKACSLTWTLREIDRALFIFHKLNPELFPKSGKGC